ncbi:MAG: DUF1834 family protein [Methylococcales bacterium]|nr:DUF1834 family protein [Methylococcales bacterium]
MSITDVLDAIQTKVDEALPALRRCEVHGGRFDLKELRRVATKTPAVFISLLAAPEIKIVATGERDITLLIGVHIVTSDKPRLPRNVSVINILQALLLLIPINDWGLKKIDPPESINAQNLYSGDVDKHGIAMWAISFKQTVRLGCDLYLEDGVIPTEIYWSESPKIGVDHKDDYEQIV